MVEGKAVIQNPVGMHARCATQFVSFVNKYNCHIELIKDNKVANAKSILNVLMLGLNQNNEFTVRVKGKEEELVLKEILEYITLMHD